MPTHIPALAPNDLEIALQRIDMLAIDPAAKRQLKAMLKAASNPDTEKIETILKTLPKARQEEIQRIFDEIATRQQAQIDEANRRLLLLGLLTLGGLLTSYLLTTDQQALTAGQLFEQSKRVWLSAIQDEIDYVGVNARAQGPNGVDYDYLRQMCDDDAVSITATYNRDIERRINKLYEEFPNASKEFYIQSLRAWAEDRSGYKGIQIAANTEFKVREYAKRRFAEENYPVTTKWIFVGPAPTCEDCTTRFAAGIVDFQYTLDFPTPRHVACPHSYRPIRKPKNIDVSNLWVG